MSSGRRYAALAAGPALLLALVSAAIPAESGWHAFADPTGTVTIDVPSSWQPQKPIEMSFGSIIGFRLPDAAVEFTISITPHLKLPDELAIDGLAMFFPPGSTLGEPQRTRGEGWSGVRLDATAAQAGGSRAWLGQFYGVGSTMIAMTLSDDSAAIEPYRDVFERIVKSARFHAARRDSAQLAWPRLAARMRPTGGEA